MSNSTIDCRSSVQEIGSGNGIRSMISGFAVFVNENSKAGSLRFGVSLAAGINSIAPPLGVRQDRINGFIREGHPFLR
jgi:hypothetical protein